MSQDLQDITNDPRAILLVGPRASGKTVLGEALAARLGWEFLDADQELVRRYERTIADWLAEDDEGFRAAEEALLDELVLLPRTIVALGGGIVESPSAVARMRTHQRVLGLTAPLEILVERQKAAPRPSLIPGTLENEVETLWKRREPAYERAAGGRWIQTDCELDAALDSTFAALRSI